MIGFFNEAHGKSAWMTHAGGWAGIVTAAVARYASAALVVQGMADRAILPIGAPLWSELPKQRRVGMPARAR